MALAWGQFLWFLHYNWSSESSYNYGWLVPALTALLLWPHLQNRAPSPAPPSLWSQFIIVGSLIGFALARLLIEVNPFWRLPLWMAALALIVGSWALMRTLFDKQAARKSLFPLFFSLSMVPWPTLIENRIIDVLTDIVTKVSVESLQVLGHPAEQLGNLIQIGTTTVGVEEACSGIKSLQALGMMALFVGAFWGLRVSGRVALLISAVILTSLFNLARTLTLSLLVLNGGQILFDEWHDTVGYIALGLGLIALFALGSKLPGAPIEPKAADTDSKSLRSLPSISKTLSIVCLALAALPFFISELWYQDNEQGDTERIDWTVDLQAYAAPDIETEALPIPDRVRAILGFDYGHHLAIEEALLSKPAELWYYGFTGESKSKSLMAYGHSPTICMSASGAIMREKLEPLRIDLGALEIPFQHYSFQLPNGQMSQVFWCLWDDLHRGETESVDGASRLAQFQSFFERKRSLQRKIALLGIPGASPEKAREDATRIVRSLFLLEQNGETFRYR